MSYRDEFREAQREYYWTLPRVTIAIGVTLLALFGIGQGLRYFGLTSESYFAPKQEAIRRDTMIQSRAYGEATMREMYRLRLQHMQAKTDAERDAIAAMVRHESQSFDRSLLPADLQAFLFQIGA